MTPIAQHARFQTITMRIPGLQRPGRRAFSLVAGLGSILILVDAIVHPGPVSGLWTARTVGDRSALLLLPVVAIGLVTVAYGLRGRRLAGQVDADSASGATEAESAEPMTMPTPIRPIYPRLTLVETTDCSSRAA